MATLKVNRSDIFPIGTSVGAYAYGSRDGAPAGTAVETHTVSATGELQYTTLKEGARYTLYAIVGGKPATLGVVGPTETTSHQPGRLSGLPGTLGNLAERRRARRILSKSGV